MSYLRIVIALTLLFAACTEQKNAQSTEKKDPTLILSQQTEGLSLKLRQDKDNGFIIHLTDGKKYGRYVDLYYLEDLRCVGATIGISCDSKSTSKAEVKTVIKFLKNRYEGTGKEKQYLGRKAYEATYTQLVSSETPALFPDIHSTNAFNIAIFEADMQDVIDSLITIMFENKRTEPGVSSHAEEWGKRLIQYQPISFFNLKETIKTPQQNEGQDLKKHRLVFSSFVFDIEIKDKPKKNFYAWLNISHRLSPSVNGVRLTYEQCQQLTKLMYLIPEANIEGKSIQHLANFLFLIDEFSLGSKQAWHYLRAVRIQGDKLITSY